MYHPVLLFAAVFSGNSSLKQWLNNSGQPIEGGPPGGRLTTSKGSQWLFSFNQPKSTQVKSNNLNIGSRKPTRRLTRAFSGSLGPTRGSSHIKKTVKKADIVRTGGQPQFIN